MSLITSTVASAQNANCIKFPPCWVGNLMQFGLEAEAVGALGGLGDDFVQALDLAASHQDLAGDDGGVDDGAARGVDEVGGEVADAELGGVGAEEEEVGWGADLQRGGAEAGSAGAGGDGPGLAGFDRGRVAGGVLLGEGEELEVG